MLADRNCDEARISETEEGSAEIEYSDSEESSIDAFKRIRFDKWASDIRKGQDKLYEYLRYPYRVDAIGPPGQEYLVSQIFFLGFSDITSIP